MAVLYCSISHSQISYGYRHASFSTFILIFEEERSPPAIKSDDSFMPLHGRWLQMITCIIIAIIIYSSLHTYFSLIRLPKFWFHYLISPSHFLYTSSISLWYISDFILRHYNAPPASNVSMFPPFIYFHRRSDVYDFHLAHYEGLAYRWRMSSPLLPR